MSPLLINFLALLPIVLMLSVFFRGLYVVNQFTREMDQAGDERPRIYQKYRAMKMFYVF